MKQSMSCLTVEGKTRCRFFFFRVLICIFTGFMTTSAAREKKLCCILDAGDALVPIHIVYILYICMFHQHPWFFVVDCLDVVVVVVWGGDMP